MTKIPASRLFVATCLLAVPAMAWSLNALAAPTSKAPRASRASRASRAARSRLASAPRAQARSVQRVKSAPLPTGRYLPIGAIKTLQKQHSAEPMPMLQPLWEGHALKKPMRDLLTNPAFDAPVAVKASARKTGRSANGTLLAQRFPRPVAPASPRQFRSVATTVAPRWVRYPLEFQLAGIGLGTRAVDKDRFNRIDRYGLFALHGNPTAVVRQVDRAFFTVPSPEQPRGITLGSGAGGAGANSSPFGSLALPQTPPETSSLFPQSQTGGGLPAWALAVTVQLDNNHVEWLYKRDTYSMGFVVDRLGFVDAIIVAGTSSDIARTNLEDPLHTVKLGDDLRKVLFRYGYADDIVPLANEPLAAARSDTGAVRSSGGEAGGGAAAGAAAGPSDEQRSRSFFTSPENPVTIQANEQVNATYRTYDLRYEQSYNVVFTIRNNRVVRIYIFGDPDFFSAQRRNLLRTRY